MKHIYFISIGLMCMLSSNILAQKSILYVGNENPAIAEDQAIIDSIVTLGYTVTNVSDETFNTYTADSMSGYDGIVISESISSGNTAAFKTAGYPLPCLNMEGYAPRASKWAWWADDAPYWLSVGEGAASGEQDGLTLVVSDNSHYITEDYTLNEEVVWSTSENYAAAENVGMKVADVIPTAIELATSKSASLNGFPVLWAIPEDAAPLTERMVIFCVHKAVIAPDTATAGFYNIVKRSLQWVLDDIQGGGTDINTVNNDISDVRLVTNPVNEYASFQFSLNKPGMVSVSIVNVVGQQTVFSTELPYQQGMNTMTLSTTELVPGLYIYVLKANNDARLGKMMIVR